MKNGKVTATIESNLASKQIDPYDCAVQIKSSETVMSVGHIPERFLIIVIPFSKKKEGD